jgi:transposase-like protein
MDRDALALLLKQGLSLAEIGRRFGRDESTVGYWVKKHGLRAGGYSETSVKYWIRRHGLATIAAKRRADGREAKTAGKLTAEMECTVHGRTDFRLEGRGAYRCLKCRAERVADRRREVKEILVAEAGGACVHCGYDSYLGALQFHHRDPVAKAFGIGQEGITRSLAAMRAEAAKCDLVCANCHAEIEGGVKTIGEVPDKVVPGLRHREETPC